MVLEKESVKMNKPDKLVGLAQKMQKLQKQKLEIDARIEKTRQQQRGSREKILCDLRQNLLKHQSAMQEKIKKTLRQLGIRTMITVTMQFGDGNTLNIKGISLGRNIDALERTEKKWGPEDWEIISKLPQKWNEVQRKILQQFQNAEGNPVPASQICGVDTSQKVGAINMVMSRSGLAYRIYCVEGRTGCLKGKSTSYQTYLVVQP
jgi:hypothetical protein